MRTVAKDVAAQSCGQPRSVRHKRGLKTTVGWRRPRTRPRTAIGNIARPSAANETARRPLETPAMDGRWDIAGTSAANETAERPRYTPATPVRGRRSGGRHLGTQSDDVPLIGMRQSDMRQVRWSLSSLMWPRWTSVGGHSSSWWMGGRHR